MKYKHAESEGWYCKIDDSGNKSQSWTAKNKPGYYAEMMACVAEGNEIEPRFTAEELKAKESEEAKQALESQKQTCIQLLNDSEKSVSSDPPYPDDLDKWKAFRAKIRVILKSAELKEIPKKPF